MAAFSGKSRRYVSNFLSVYRIRPADDDEEDANRQRRRGRGECHQDGSGGPGAGVQRYDMKPYHDRFEKQIYDDAICLRHFTN